MSCTRRDVLYTIGIASAAGCLAGCADEERVTPTGISTICGTDLCISLAANPELEPVGGALIFNGRGRSVMVIRRSASELVALSAVCTHAGCKVAYDGESKLDCFCHGSRFSIDGSVDRGPATAALISFPTMLAGDVLTIVLPAV